jgi:CRP-like cAMP-binding protein
MQPEDIASIALFEGLTPDELQRCAEPFREIEMVAGSSLAKQDDFAYKFFVVLEGEVDVHRNFEFVARLGPGDHFGEMALVRHEKRNARVTAHTRCRLGCMMGWDFTTMTEEFPTVAARIEAVVEEREP